MQQKDKASPCSIYEQFLEGWCWVLSFVLASLHILAYITCVWQQAVVCWVLSALQGRVLFSSHIGSTFHSVLMCQTIDSLQCRCTVETATHVSYPKSQINMFSYLLVSSSHADSLGCICQGFWHPCQWGRLSIVQVNGILLKASRIYIKT